MVEQCGVGTHWGVDLQVDRQTLPTLGNVFVKCFRLIEF
jgi:hypothetical protein